MKANLKFFAVGASLVAGGLAALAVGDLTVFQAGTPIKSAEVNSNFSTLKSAVAALEAPVDATRLADGAVSAGKLSAGIGADGKVLKMQGGALAWSDDLTGGSGGAAYTAGIGLALTGSTFSLADGGVSKSKLSASGGTDGQVLKLSGGNLTWANDLQGSGGGTTYTADGTSLQLSGTTFSVRDGGIRAAQLGAGAVTSAKIADEAITGAKLSKTLVLSDTEGLSFTHTSTAQNQTAVRIAVGTSPRVIFSNRNGLFAETDTGIGVIGFSNTGYGVWGFSETLAGLYGKSNRGPGVLGDSSESYGVSGQSPNNVGVYGASSSSIGVKGVSQNNVGVMGESQVRGVEGRSTTGIGVLGNSQNSVGVMGESPVRGVEGRSTTGIGVLGNSNTRGLVGTLNGTSCRGDLTYAVGGCAPSGTGYSAVFEGGSGGSGICTFNGGAGWNCTSDRNQKENFSQVNPQVVLAAVAQMPISRWNMKGDAKKSAHIGPVAQDFYAAFKLGDSNTTINTADAQGVALAAIQGLYQKNKALEAEVKQLKTQLAHQQSLEQRLAALEARLGSQ